MPIWDADNLNAPHTEREISQIVDVSDQANGQKPLGSKAQVHDVAGSAVVQQVPGEE